MQHFSESGAWKVNEMQVSSQALGLWKSYSVRPRGEMKRQ